MEPKYDRSAKTKESELIVASYIAAVYRERIIEMHDHSILMRMAELVHGYLAERNRAVHRAAGQALTAIYHFVLTSLSQEDILGYMLEPLQAVITSDSDLHIKQGASVLILDWVQ
jgi:hypothetical protein